MLISNGCKIVSPVCNLKWMEANIFIIFDCIFHDDIRCSNNIMIIFIWFHSSLLKFCFSNSIKRSFNCASRWKSIKLNVKWEMLLSKQFGKKWNWDALLLSYSENYTIERQGCKYRIIMMMMTTDCKWWKFILLVEKKLWRVNYTKWATLCVYVGLTPKII